MNSTDLFDMCVSSQIIHSWQVLWCQTQPADQIIQLQQQHNTILPRWQSFSTAGLLSLDFHWEQHMLSHHQNTQQPSQRLSTQRLLHSPRSTLAPSRCYSLRINHWDPHPRTSLPQPIQPIMPSSLELKVIIHFYKWKVVPSPTHNPLTKFKTYVNIWFSKGALDNIHDFLVYIFNLLVIIYDVANNNKRIFVDCINIFGVSNASEMI